MEPTTLAIFGIAGMFALIILRVPIGIAMCVAGLAGCAAIIGRPAAMSFLSTEVMAKFSSPDTAVAPMFLLMGNLATISGLSGDLYRLAHVCVGHFRGGLAMATVAGCGFFGAICGSSAATTATFTSVALPEMINRNYSKYLATGVIAAGGCLGTLVPPSVPLVLYAVMTGQFIVELFMAAFIPAMLCILLFFVTVWLICLVNPQAGPAGQRRSAMEVLDAFKKSWAAILLLLGVLGGIYAGIFTVNEGAAVGCVLSLIFAVIRKAINRKTIGAIIKDTVVAMGMIYIIMIGAGIFGYFIALSGIAQVTVDAITAAGMPNWLIITLLMFVYFIMGAIFDCLAAMLITLPLVVPIITGMGYSLVWWGIVNMVIINIGQISPPIGLNVFVLKSLSGYNLGLLYRGVAPFMLAAIALLAVLIAWPHVVLFLPTLLMGF
ncbi:MAG: TRAP transporter large permease [Deltaproteobacteria bacterium]|jgi:tripartite ATP-independent transporter DctM subunit|nr:TRAP transporter large permease [Deltaproteobacteria bacterium]